MEVIRRKYLTSPQYLASPKVLGPPQWKPKNTGHTLASKDPGGILEITVLSVIGKVSDAGYYVDGLGSWRDTFKEPMEKAKYQMQLERPEGTVFADDWDVAVAHITKLQDRIRTTDMPKNLVVKSNPTEAYLRFTKHAFETKTSDSPEGYNTDEWPVQENYEEQFFITAQKFVFTPIRARTIRGQTIGGYVISDTLRGALVEVVFSVRHYKLKDLEFAWYDSFSGCIIEEIILLDEGVPMKVMKYVTASTIGDDIADVTSPTPLTPNPHTPVTSVHTAPLTRAVLPTPSTATTQVDMPISSHQANKPRKRGPVKSIKRAPSKGSAAQSSASLRRPTARGSAILNAQSRAASRLPDDIPHGGVTATATSAGSVDPRIISPTVWPPVLRVPSADPSVRRSARRPIPRVIPDAADEDQDQEMPEQSLAGNHTSSFTGSLDARELSPDSDQESDFTDDESYEKVQEVIAPEHSRMSGHRSSTGVKRL
ncbi:hypothetical protein C8F01DRAFT_1307076 [Mycena amicta]|nr:hypothetical protein C8F01DRAFT_1307076 [Mycena amicta]